MSDDRRDRAKHAFMTGITSMGGPTTPKAKDTEERARRDYVEGRIEIDEFEQRIDAILHGRPRLVACDSRDQRFGPGVAIPFDPRDGIPTTFNEAALLARAARIRERRP